MNNLGYLYKRGGNGILRDMPEAIFWFRRLVSGSEGFVLVGVGSWLMIGSMVGFLLNCMGGLLIAWLLLGF